MAIEVPRIDRVDNFNAGPAALPADVLFTARQELLNYKGTGMSVLEMSHRSAAYEEIQVRAEQALTRLLDIPEGYSVLFLQGGASLQFLMLPLNFASPEAKGSYILTGSWAEKAYDEAQRLQRGRVAVSGKSTRYSVLPKVTSELVQETDAYLHVTSNNTIYGTQFQSEPEELTVPLVADMSSDFLSKSVAVDRFSLIYAGAQKNLGPAGVTIVLVKNEFLDKAGENPPMLSYGTHAKHQSRYNTPPVFAVYLVELVLEHVLQSGGLQVQAEKNERKASLIYDVIDTHSDFFDGHASREARSRMNITFRLPNDDLSERFVQEAAECGMVGLKGHRSVGGCRASLYNAVSYEAAERLAHFMEAFYLKWR